MGKRVELSDYQLENGSDQTGMVVDPKIRVIVNIIATSRAATIDSIGVGDGVIKSG